MDYFYNSSPTINSYLKTPLALKEFPLRGPTLHGLALASLGAYYFLLQVKDWQQDLLVYLTAFSCLTLFFALSIYVLRIDSTVGSNGERYSGRIAGIVLLWGIVFRLFLAFFASDTHTPLSTDVYRYLWEGEVVAAGENPYQLAPDAEALSSLRATRADLHARVSHKELGSIYPPGAQYLFALLPKTLPLFRLVLVGLDCLTLFILWRFLRTQKAGAQRLLWYAWLPLAVIEIAYSAHLEALFLPLVVFSLLQLEKRGGSRVLPACLLAVAMSIKYVAVIPLCFELLSSLERKRILYQVYRWLLPISLFAATFLPFLDENLSVFHSLRTYGEHWRFNGALFQLGEYALATFENPARIMKYFGASCVLLLALYLLKRKIAVKDASILSYAVILILSPTVYPWYLLWFAVLLPISTLPNYLNYALLSFCCSSLLSYEVLAHPEAWEVSRVILIIEYMIPLMVGSDFYAKSRRASRRDMGEEKR